MLTPLTSTERLERMRSNMRRFGYLPRLELEETHGRSIAICGFGPSLVDTWKKVRKHPVMTTSGAHDFLIRKGIIPKYHVETDPREHKVEFVKNSHPDVTYFVNSQCHPLMFETLANRKVVMWHGFTDDDRHNQLALVDEFYPGLPVLAGGTNVGMRAIPVARALGYTGFELHGMDCCYRGKTQWAGEHFTPKHKTVLIEVEDRRFETSELMMQSTDDFFNVMRMMPGCRFRIHGDGLLEARLKIFIKDSQKALNVGWWKPVNFALHDPYEALAKISLGQLAA